MSFGSAIAQTVLCSRLQVATTITVFLASGGAGVRAQDLGHAAGYVRGGSCELRDGAIAADWNVRDGHIAGLRVRDLRAFKTLALPDAFAIRMKDGTVLNARSLRAEGTGTLEDLTANPQASRAADHVAGKQYTLVLSDAAGKTHVAWSLLLRDGSNYIRQRVTITAGGADLPIAEVRLIDVNLPAAHVEGSVKGSPVVGGRWFLGFEDPLSESKVEGDHATAAVNRELPLRDGQSVTYSAVIGVSRAGQMRRDFLNYLERERAHPYRTFLHYNSWYDLGYFNPYDEAGALDRVRAFGTELHDKRGVTLDSFLFDDGWDNHQSLWSFHSGFPNGMSAVAAEAKRFGAAPGMWLSPWGGYDGPKKERVQFGREQGYEIVADGFALSGPKYYQHFLDVCLEMIRKYGVNQFKFDGTGNANAVFPGSAFDSDFDAAMHVIAALRQAEPGIFINLTTGTYPSPFWLLYADSTWRGGEDQSVAGVGTARERWITYRDAQTYKGVVERGPLYPLNSLMLHGIIYARFDKQLNTDPGDDFRNEVRSYFGTGTQCQEMYITPSLLSSKNWDDLAEAAKWSRRNAGVLRDTHWVGGDPAKLEAYGWAAWSPRKAILTLRNPSDREQTLRLRLRDALELPTGAAQAYAARSPWKDDASQPATCMAAGQTHEFHLLPFQVLTLELTPSASGCR